MSTPCFAITLRTAITPDLNRLIGNKSDLVADEFFDYCH